MAELGLPRETTSARGEVVAIVVSLVIVLSSIVWTWSVGQDANRLAHRLDHAQQELVLLRLEVVVVEERAR